MRIIKNTKGISTLFLILLLIVSAIIGALLSYLWVVGYYESLEYRNPETPSITISDATFSPQNTTYFNLTLLYPTYSTSKEPAVITKITVSTEDDVLHKVAKANPSLPYSFPKGDSKVFECSWNWANYTGETIEISVSIEKGSGPTRKYKTPLVDLQITDVHFNPTISVSHFNMTVKNSESSVTHVNVTRVVVNEENVTVLVPRTLPYALHPNDSAPFMCSWNWTNYQNTSVIVVVHTLQGYMNYATKVTPLPVILEITKVLFDPTNTTCFDVTVRNDKGSPTHVDIIRITATMENGTIQEIDGTKVSPQIDPSPYPLDPNVTENFKCPWNWARYWGKNVTITVRTLQNFTVQYAGASPSPINITDVIFNPAFTNQSTVIVNNSEFYYANVNITDIKLTVENETFPINGTEVNPPLPYQLSPNSSISFLHPWNWTDYQGKSVTIIVQSAENYTAHFTKVTSKRVILAITSVLFDTIDTTSFNLTVRNSESSLDDAYISKVIITLENGTIREIALSETVSPNSTVTLGCPWVWTTYRGKNITIAVHTTKGYETSTLYTTPPES